MEKILKNSIIICMLLFSQLFPMEKNLKVLNDSDRKVELLVDMLDTLVENLKTIDGNANIPGFDEVVCGCDPTSYINELITSFWISIKILESPMGPSFYPSLSEVTRQNILEIDTQLKDFLKINIFPIGDEYFVKEVLGVWCKEKKCQSCTVFDAYVCLLDRISARKANRDFLTKIMLSSLKSKCAPLVRQILRFNFSEKNYRSFLEEAKICSTSSRCIEIIKTSFSKKFGKVLE